MMGAGASAGPQTSARTVRTAADDAPALPQRHAHASSKGTATVSSTESDFLLSLAALSLSFTGFSAVVVTLRGALGGEISDRHLRLVRLYIEGGLLVTALSVIPALLNLLHIPAPTLWAVSSAVAATIFSVLLLTQFRRRSAIETGPFPAWVRIIYAISLLAVIALWLNAAGAPFPPSVGAYAITLTWALCVFGFIFIRTIDIFLSRGRP
jgi:hypothetical protein